MVLFVFVFLFLRARKRGLAAEDTLETSERQACGVRAVLEARVSLGFGSGLLLSSLHHERKPVAMATQVLNRILIHQKAVVLGRHHVLVFVNAVVSRVGRLVDDGVMVFASRIRARQHSGRLALLVLVSIIVATVVTAVARFGEKVESST